MAHAIEFDPDPGDGGERAMETLTLEIQRSLDYYESHFGQPFTVTATAYNAFGAVTRNYDGTLGFAKTTTFSDAAAVTGGSFGNDRGVTT